MAFVILCVSSSAAAQEVSVNPTRPSAADNAYITSFGYTEIEVGWSRVSSAWSSPTLLKASVAQNLELALSTTGILQKSTGSAASWGTPGGQAKWRLFSGDWGAFAGVAHLDFPSDGPPQYTVYPVVSLKSEPASIDLTMGGTSARPFSPKSQSSYFYALAVAPNLGSAVSFYGELYGTLSAGKPVHAADVGVSYSFSPRLVFDFAIGAGISPQADDWTFQIGLTTSLFKLF